MRVKEEPIRRSISCLASTALASLGFGATKLLTAWCKSRAIKAEKRARLTNSLGFTFRHTSMTCKTVCNVSHLPFRRKILLDFGTGCIFSDLEIVSCSSEVDNQQVAAGKQTSKAMFSPSLSQSSHRTNQSHCLACCSRLTLRSVLSCITTMQSCGFSRQPCVNTQ